MALRRRMFLQYWGKFPLSREWLRAQIYIRQLDGIDYHGFHAVSQFVLDNFFNEVFSLHL